MKKKYEDYREDIEKKYRELLSSVYREISEEERKMIDEAFNIAEKAHRNQVRMSGEPYIFHPLSVALIVSEQMGLEPISISCALLHDVVEDTEWTLDDIRSKLGQKIAEIVKGLTKISEIKIDKNKNVSLQAENFRKMLLTISDDIRVIFVKLADRLHNMQTMESMPEHKRIRISSETMYIYAPLAHRLGLHNIKTLLEDLSLKYLKNEEYKNIENKILSDKPNLEKCINSFRNQVKDRLEKEGISFTIKSRIKSIYSIYKKNTEKNIPFEEVYDKLAIRVIYKSSLEDEKFIAWKIYSIVTDYYKSNPSRLRDWISTPKLNGYESLHITVMGPEANWIEVQIRSERMDEIAEIGYAAHYRYKNKDSKADYLDKWLSMLKETLEQPDKDPIKFIEEFKLSLHAKEIYVFTPKGDLISLPKGSTVLDYAFAIHTDIGLKCIGGKVNGIIAPIKYEIKNGDRVEVITSKQQKPNEEWFSIVNTSRARNKINSFLNKQKNKDSQYGEELFYRKLRKLGLSKFTKEDLINKCVLFFGKEDRIDFFYDVYKKYISNQQIREFYNFYTKKESVRKKITNVIKPFNIASKSKKKADVDEKNTILFGSNKEKLNYTIAKCCMPEQGDDIFGFISSENQIKVHKIGCQNEDNIRSNYSYRLLSATWSKEIKKNYLKINIKSLVDNEVVQNLIDIASNRKLEITNINISREEQIYNIHVVLKMDPGISKELIMKEIRKNKMVKSVKEA